MPQHDQPLGSGSAGRVNPTSNVVDTPGQGVMGPQQAPGYKGYVPAANADFDMNTPDPGSLSSQARAFGQGAGLRPIWSQSTNAGMMYGRTLTPFQKMMLQEKIMGQFGGIRQFGGQNINRQQNQAFDYWMRGQPLRTMPWGVGQPFQRNREWEQYGSNQRGQHVQAPWERIMQSWHPKAAHRYNPESWNFENQWQQNPEGFMADPSRRPGANLPFSELWNPYMRMDTDVETNPLLGENYGM